MKTFVVRIWTPAEPTAADHDLLHGIVEHIGSGRSTPFGDEGELVAFLREASVPRAASAGEGYEPPTTKGGRR